jgi:3-methyladenine DNA glycosylase AlkD
MIPLWGADERQPDGRWTRHLTASEAASAGFGRWPGLDGRLADVLSNCVKKIVPARPAKAAAPALEAEVQDALTWLERHSTDRDRDNLKRFGITADKAFGVSMANIQVLAKRIGRNHDLAAALWETGWYEARMLTSFVDEPSRVTSAQMDRWCRDFDNWGICDTLCFCLFDRTPHAWAKVAQWRGKRDEFGKRAAFALLASLAGHDKTSGDAPFKEGLRFIEGAAGDERNFVKKGVSWALRMIGRRNAALNAEAVRVARRLSASTDAAARWVGKGALKELTSTAVTSRLAGRSPKRRSDSPAPASRRRTPEK